jgi:hypothetical protein
MRGLRKTTTRWLWPTELRAERFAELQAKKKYADLLGAEFIAGLEKRSDLLEGRYYKGLAIQIPLFFILALSLLNVDVKAAFLGFSIESAKSIREILLVLSVPVALFIAVIQLRLTSINEMLKNSIARIARDDVDLKDFLDVRYGLSYFVSKPYGRRELGFGYTQLIASLAAILLVFSLIGLMLIVALIVQIACIREVYLHPNFSPSISKLVIAVVIGGDIALLLMAFLSTSIQPYQSWEDWNKLAELADRDPERVKQILQKIVADHASSGSLKRIFGRPRMKRMP